MELKWDAQWAQPKVLKLDSQKAQQKEQTWVERKDQVLGQAMEQASVS